MINLINNCEKLSRYYHDMDFCFEKDWQWSGRLEGVATDSALLTRPSFFITSLFALSQSTVRPNDRIHQVPHALIMSEKFSPSFSFSLCLSFFRLPLTDWHRFESID